MIEVRRSEARGKASFGWLQSRHTFSFASYYDPAQMGFSSLRVINDDKVIPGAGFDTHGHRDMEILSMVLEGQIAHKDSAGNTEILPAGEYQLMSAGQGIYHSEFNPSKTEPLHFLQIWIEPDVRGGQPGYQQKDFGQQPGLTLILSPDGQDSSMVVRQNTKLYQLIIPANGKDVFRQKPGRRIYLHLISGQVEVAGQNLEAGDGIKISDLHQLELQAGAKEPVKALIFDLP